MIDLNDKKNLPIVIAIAVVVVVGAGFLLYKQIRGPQTAQATPPTVPTGGVSSQAGPGGAPGMPPGGTAAPGTPGSAGSSTPDSWAAPPGGMVAATASPTPQTPGASPMAGTPGQAGTALQAGGLAAQQPRPDPVELWRPDPFAPLAGPDSGRGTRPPVQRIQIPPIGRIFQPKPIDIQKEFPQIRPQPPRRVAGILLGDRISALLQTQDGWETVRPGGTLKDGSVVERIERDRVIIRTAEKNPRIVEVKLAAAEIETSSTTPTAGGSRSPYGPGPYGPYGPYGPGGAPYRAVPGVGPEARPM